MELISKVTINFKFISNLILVFRTSSPGKQRSVSQSMLRRTYMPSEESPNRERDSRRISSKSPVDKLRISSSMKSSLNRQPSLSPPRSPSPHTGRHLSSPVHTDQYSLSRSQSPPRSPSPHTGRHLSSSQHSPSRSQHSQRGRSRSPKLTTHQQGSDSGGLAHQLQNIVRTEMRRIMEVLIFFS